MSIMFKCIDTIDFKAYNKIEDVQLYAFSGCMVNRRST